ncbi:unnamed protein product, partial [Brachionus calyciflorus]
MLSHRRRKLFVCGAENFTLYWVQVNSQPEPAAFPPIRPIQSQQQLVLVLIVKRPSLTISKCMVSNPV